MWLCSDSKDVQKDLNELRCRICLETFPAKKNSDSKGRITAESSEPGSSDSNGKTKADGSECGSADSKGEVIDLDEESSDLTGTTKAETPDSPGEVLELGCKCKDAGKVHKHCALKWFKDTKQSS